MVSNPRRDSTTEDRLVAAYLHDRSMSNRNAIVEYYVRDHKYHLITANSIWHRYDGFVKRYCDNVELDDLVGETLLCLPKAIDTFNPAKDTRLSTWVINSMRMAALEYIREKMRGKRGAMDNEDRRILTTSLDSDLPTGHSSNTDPHYRTSLYEILQSDIEDSDMILDIKNALSKLRPLHRAIVIARIYQQKTFKEIAKDYSFGESRARRIFVEATNALRAILTGAR